MKKNRLLSMLTAAVIAFSFTACSASSHQKNASADRGAMYDVPTEYAVEEEVAYDQAETGSIANAKQAGGSALSSSISGTKMPENLTLKLIWRANVSMETLEFDNSLQEITALVGELGGFVESSSSSGGSDAQGNYINKYADFTIRIPSDKLDGFIGRLNDCGTVTDQRLSSENISLQYADTEARKKALQTEYDRLIELMAQAETVDAVIAVEARLSEVRLQLDSLSSTLRTYDNLVDYATVYLNIHEVRKISGTNAVTIPERIKNGLSDTIYGIKVFFEDAVVFLVVNIPVFVILAVVVAAALFVLRKLRRRDMSADSKRTDAQGTEEKK